MHRNGTIDFIIFTIVLGGILLLSGCSQEKVSGPVNTAPVIDSIITDPSRTNPGGEFRLNAYATDPDGDSISYHWSTWPLAAFFSDTSASTCSVLVNQKLSGGMKLLLALEANDGQTTSFDSLWMPLTHGRTIYGHVYFQYTQIPIPATEIQIRRLIDTSNARGEYHLNHVQIGESILYASKTDCTDYSAIINIPDTLTSDSLEYDIILTCDEMISSMSGNVSNSDGIDLADIIVTVLNNDKTATDLTAITDASGNFTIDNIPQGERLVTIESDAIAYYDILPDTFLIELNIDTSISLIGRTQTQFYVSTGLDNLSDWLLEDDESWKSWGTDVTNQCYYYNSCEMGEMGKLGWVNSITLPADVEALSYRIEADISDILFLISYGVVINDTTYRFEHDFSGYAGNSIIKGIMTFGEVNPAGQEFFVEFYAIYFGSDATCGIVCLKELTISYFR